MFIFPITTVSLERRKGYRPFYQSTMVFLYPRDMWRNWGSKWPEAAQLVVGRLGGTRTPQGLQLVPTLLSRDGGGKKRCSTPLLDRTGEHKDFFLTNSVFASISWAVPGSIQPQVGKRSILPTLDFISAFHFIQNFTSVWVFSRPYKNCQTILENNVKRGQGFFFFFLGGPRFL